ncbi:hypothetical protein GCM10017557_05150 [Streptomyces aurantiacus]|uniref:Uncharacterized protein n=1 Tax=Streptomyces aurantiacus TaxID=47760 RepID=A0A7G1NVM7_9ACTN|nr:hypothetical protein GCM10017557_05150 [Streptomyces aurantiacus]
MQTAVGTIYTLSGRARAMSTARRPSPVSPTTSTSSPVSSRARIPDRITRDVPGHLLPPPLGLLTSPPHIAPLRLHPLAHPGHRDHDRGHASEGPSARSHR